MCLLRRLALNHSKLEIMIASKKLRYENIYMVYILLSIISIKYVIALPMVLKMISRHEIKNDPTYFFSAHV